MKKIDSLCLALPLMLALAATFACTAATGNKPALRIPALGVLTASPPSVSFGNVETSTIQKQSVTLTNVGGSTLAITKTAIISGGTAGFATNGLPLPLNLAVGQSQTFEVSFQPQSAGSFNGHMEFTDDGEISPVSVGFSGTGVVPNQLVTNPTSFSFGDVQVGTSQSQTATLLNGSSESRTVSAAAVSDAAFSITGLSLPLTLAPNQRTTFGIQFAPKMEGSSNGNLALILTGRSTSVHAALSGTGVPPAMLIVDRANLTFSRVPVGTTQTQTETLQNKGGAKVTVSQAWITGTGFSIAGLTLPLTLGPGESMSWNVIFAPKFKGNFRGSVSFISDASNPSQIVSLSGSATGTSGQLIVSPAAVNVGTVAVGSIGTRSGTLTATGASVTVTTVTKANSSSSEFAISGLKIPITIGAGQSVKFAVKFRPQTSGVASVDASFTSNAANSPTTAIFSGKAVAAQMHKVDLAWTASISRDVTGYNVYRAVYGTSCEAYSKIGSSFSTTYMDTAATGGVTYCYAATAVNSSDQESEYSKPVQAVVPLP